MSQTDTDEPTTETTEDFGANEVLPGDAEAGRSKPTYGILDVADEVPPQDTPNRGTRGPDMRIHNLLEQLMVEDDLAAKWVKVVRYSTSNGAKLAYDSIEDGTRIIPDGDFDFEVRRVTDDGGKRVSELWARYNGPA